MKGKDILLAIVDENPTAVLEAVEAAMDDNISLLIEDRRKIVSSNFLLESEEPDGDEDDTDFDFDDDLPVDDCDDEESDEGEPEEGEKKEIPVGSGGE